MNAFQLGDMAVYGDVPPKMLKALAVIADTLHAAYDALPDTIVSSKDKCMFCSLAVREFLVAIGYRDANVRICAVLIDGERDGVGIQSLGIGMPDDKRVIDGKFNGHAVVEIPSLGMLIDTTLYQAQRERWNGALPGMMALPIVVVEPPIIFEGLTLFTGMEAHEKDNDAAWLRVAYFDRPDINLRRQTDYNDPRSRERRRIIARAMREKFGKWTDAS